MLQAMLDSLGGGIGSPLFFDSGLSGLLPLSPSQQQPTSTDSPSSWLFTSQSVYGAQSSAPQTSGRGELTSLLASLDTSQRPSSTFPDPQQKKSFDVSQLAGVPLKQMASGRYGNRRAYGIVPSSYQGGQPSPGAPGTPVPALHSPQSQSSPSSVTPKNPKLYKTELCRSWMDHGRCNYGERCQYAHGEHEKRPIPRHPKYKTEACQSYHQTGYCPYGARCHFIHNETELLNRRAPSAFGGSTGESPAPSSAESQGSESPKASFSPSEADERRHQTLARFPWPTQPSFDFMRAPQPPSQRSSLPAQPFYSRSVSVETHALPSSIDPLNGLIGQVLNWGLDEPPLSAPAPIERPSSLRPSSEDPSSRLPVFTQLSNASI